MTTLAPARADLSKPAVRVRSAPPLEPPYDEERGSTRSGGGEAPSATASSAAAGWQAQTLPFADQDRTAFERQVRAGRRMPRGGVAGTAASTTVGTTVGTTAGTAVGLAPGTGPGARLGTGPGTATGVATGTAGIPRQRQMPGDPRRFAARLAQLTAEVLAGARPLAQIAPLLSPTVRAVLSRRVRFCRTAPDLRRGRRPSNAPARAPVVVMSRPGPGVAEAGVVLHREERSRAYAIRLELRQDRWCCTALEIV